MFISFKQTVGTQEEKALQQTVPRLRSSIRVPRLKGLPLVGNLPQFQRRPLATLLRAAREGGGPRICIGNSFALMEATLVVATVMQRYRLDLVPGQTVEPNPKGTLRPRPGVWMMPRVTGAF